LLNFVILAYLETMPLLSPDLHTKFCWIHDAFSLWWDGYIYLCWNL